jgi:hypothetical protein
MVFATRKTGQCLAIHTTNISQFAATFNEARNQGFEGFLHLGELQFGFGQGFYDEAFGVFRGEVASGGHFADEEILGAL